ncbi:RNA-binding protein 39 [Sporothrix brasiliensis 5110]|uniref:RNA-binding protein 39 n=1 Tax=Sporothrix brasiliensis 5110 TaxID=1398154 RepID=A0A0C2IX05_9PEZI|nr:RNA-binding protein 39 [Sporothrix brasiliensis 5110]KIH91295.1 RNA-binding protein 39 [Sporothrix brasiliensis 5110]
MAHLDVEALLDAAASGDGQDRSGGRSPRIDDARNGGAHTANGHHSGRSSRSRSLSRTRSRSPRSDRERERERADRDRADRDRDRRRREPRSQSPRGNANGTSGGAGADVSYVHSDDRERTPARSEAGSHRSSRRRSRSPRRRRRNRGHGGGGDRSRSRSPNRYYRPRDSRRDRDDRLSGRSPRDRSRDRVDRYGRDRSRESRRGGGGGRSASPPAVGERDRRTVFVQQLAARLRTRELKEFFEKAGPVAEAQIVKDRVSNRSKGVGYVEFKSEDTIAAALQLTGQKLLGIPVIVQVTEAEKNRQVRNTAETPTGGNATGVPFHRLYVGNIHFSITESDLRNVFEPFGELEFVQLQKDESGRSRGYGFVQFRDSNQAREALEKMNGFDLAGRPIRVGLGNDKFTPESTAHLMQRFQGRDQAHNGNSRDADRRGNGGASGNFDRAGARDSDKGSGAGALDDTDVAGVNFNSYSRDALMRKLARTDDVGTSSSSPATNGAGHNGYNTANGGSDAVEQQRPIMKPRNDPKPLPVGVNVNLASRCVVLHNMFDAAEEEGDDWVKELEDDVRQEAEDKYGHVLHVALDQNSNGDIYLKFDKVQGGENAIKGLNGRYFGGRMITAAPVVDAVYSSLFSRSKAM